MKIIQIYFIHIFFNSKYLISTLWHFSQKLLCICVETVLLCVSRCLKFIIEYVWRHSYLRVQCSAFITTLFLYCRRCQKIIFVRIYTSFLHSYLVRYCMFIMTIWLYDCKKISVWCRSLDFYGSQGITVITINFHILSTKQTDIFSRHP